MTMVGTLGISGNFEELFFFLAVCKVIEMCFPPTLLVKSFKAAVFLSDCLDLREYQNT